MLPHIINLEADEHIVQAGKRRGRIYLLFVSREAARSTPLKPHYVRECADRPTLVALQRWFVVRHDLWQQWGELAETIGADAFWDHMEALLMDDPPELPSGIIIEPLDDAREVAIAEVLHGERGSRMETLYVHRFASVDLRSSFLDMYQGSDSGDIAREVFTVGWSNGSAELGRLLDEMATTYTAAATAGDRSR